VTTQGWGKGAGTWTAQWVRTRNIVIARDGNVCAHCGTTVHRRCNPNGCGRCRHVGHVIAKSDGGLDHPNNCKVLCRDCNLRGPASSARNSSVPLQIRAPQW